MARRGVLRVYLGAAPGVGKTYAMLDEGHRRAARGTDVVIGYVETHGRQHTAEKIEGLEVVPRCTRVHRGARFEEMDLDAVLARAPKVALVDELAHTNVPGGRHEKRWQDVEALLEAGIDVISTVNVQHLESLNDVVEEITGVAQRETVPDSVVRAADQVELVDMTAEALRRRMAHGNIYAPEKIDAALANYFRHGNLTALRELALLWLADSVDEGLQKYREAHGIDQPWETRERVVVALTGGPEGETLIRRASRIAARVSGGELIAVHVARSDGLSGASPAALSGQRLLVEALGGSYHSIVGDNVTEALLEFAAANNATQIVIGTSRRKPFAAALSGAGTGASIIRQSGQIDVHVVTHDYAGRGRTLPALTRGLTRQRRLLGLAATVLLLSALTVLSTALRPHITLATDLLLYLLAVILVCLIGGFWPALLAAVVASLLLNYFLVPPVHTLTISQPENALALAVFVLIAALVSRVVDVAADRRSQAARATAEAETLSTLAGSLLRGESALPALLDRVRETFSMDSVSLLRRDTTAPASTGDDARGRWSVLAETGPDPCTRPQDADTEVPLDDELSLALRGRVLPAEDQRVLTAFASQVAVAYRQRELAEAAEAALPLAESDRMRTALLNAVSHDLRTPLATAKAAVSGLADDTVTWSDDDRHELLNTAGAALDRLTDLVTNLLDLSRLQAGVLSAFPRPVGLEDVVSQALAHVAADRDLDLDVPDTLPEVLADPGLLERVIANLVQNALRHSPEDKAVRIAGSAHGGRVQLRVIDRGAGIPPEAQQQVFEPFQRLHDHANSEDAGAGLGLAIARGFSQAMAGSLTLEDTPGGGVTMVVELPACPDGLSDEP
jgi:two-component system sensor histidine kinase KdpD